MKMIFEKWIDKYNMSVGERKSKFEFLIGYNWIYDFFWVMIMYG